MKRMKVVLFAACLATGLVGTAPGQHAVIPLGDPSQGLYVIQTIMPGMAINNLLVVRPDRVVLVDTTVPIPGFYASFRAAIDLPTQGRPVGNLITTHWHGDHTGLNGDFRVNEGTQIIGHWRTAAFMAEDRYIEDLGMFIPAAPPEAWPTEAIRGEKTLPLSGETILLKTVENAHSASDLVVYLAQANVVYTGDLYFGEMFPVIDRSSGGTVNGMLHACRQLLARINDQTLVVPSHGPLGNRQSVLDFTAMLETSRARIRALLDLGMTEQEVLAANPLADLDARWGHGFLPTPVFTLIVYRDLAPQPGS